MRMRCVRIERVCPRPGRTDQAFRYKHGYKLGDPALSSRERKLTRNCVYVATLDEAAALVERGWHIRMGVLQVRAAVLDRRDGFGQQPIRLAA
jgi:hypothetical protein